MIPSYLADLDLPAVFAVYTSTPCKYLQESVQDEHVVDSTSQGVSGFVSASFLKKLRKVEAYICFREGYPKSTSSQMNCKVRFMAQNGIPLSFERKKIL